MATTRRAFLNRMGQVTAAGILVPRPFRSARPEDTLLSLGLRHYDEAELKAIAIRALDAAKKAGALYADVRVNFGMYMAASTFNGKSDGPGLISSATVGIRAVTNGVWGFAGEATVSMEVIDRLAELAVARARAGRPRVAKEFDYVDAPKDSGRWDTPVKTDPFTIPFKEHEAIVLDAAEAVQKIEGLRFNMGGAEFNRKDTVFASSEGTLVFQKIYNAAVGGMSQAPSKKDPDTWIAQGSETPSGPYGYEALRDSDLKGKWIKAANETLRLGTLPIKSVDVGRYDVVFGRRAVASFVMSTIAGAVMLNRARGDLANSLGTSYAAPPMDVLGKLRIGSDLLTVKADRSRPNAGNTVGWDEDGVKPEDFTLVQNGLLTDYITNRETANTIADWYKNQGKPVRSHGCATGTGMAQPNIGMPNLSVQPGRASAKEEDLYRDIKKGFYCPSGSAGPDQQLINCAGYFGQPIYEIASGKIAGLVKDFGIQFNTTQFWKNLTALGGANSTGLENMMTALMYILDVPNFAGVQAVPARVKDVNVINTGKES